MNNDLADKRMFKANGKLLLSGEYTILDGAWGIGLPVKLGQQLQVIYDENYRGPYQWKSLDVDNEVWFQCKISEDIRVLEATDDAIGNRLEQILKVCVSMNPSMQLNSVKEISTHLEFDRDWGLGSSSTLIYLLAKWFDIDPFDLLNNTLGGSGYDIACAGTERQLLISRQNDQVLFHPVTFYPPYSEHLYFVYLEQKQNTSDALNSYLRLNFDRKKTANLITEISHRMLETKSLEDFQALVKAHEEILSETLKIEPVQSKLFLDFNGAIKSMGAWGGDFVMVASGLSEESTHNYFKNRGYSTILSFNELVFSTQ